MVYHFSLGWWLARCRGGVAWRIHCGVAGNVMLCCVIFVNGKANVGVVAGSWNESSYDVGLLLLEALFSADPSRLFLRN